MPSPTRYPSWTREAGRGARLRRSTYFEKIDGTNGELPFAFIQVGESQWFCTLCKNVFVVEEFDFLTRASAVRTHGANHQELHDYQNLLLVRRIDGVYRVPLGYRFRPNMFLAFFRANFRMRMTNVWERKWR